MAANRESRGEIEDTLRLRGGMRVCGWGGLAPPMKTEE